MQICMSENGQYVFAADDLPIIQGNNGFTAKGIGALSNDSGLTFTPVPLLTSGPYTSNYRACAVSGGKKSLYILFPPPPW